MPYHVQINCRITQGRKTGGFGMHFWNSSTDLGPVVEQTYELAKAINAVMSNQCFPTSARISKDGAFRDVTPIKDLKVSQVDFGSDWDGDRATAAIQLLHHSDGPYDTLQWLRGVPDDVCTLGGKYTPARVSDYAKRINALFSVLNASGNSWAQRKLTLANAYKPIQSFAIQTGIFSAAGVTAVEVNGITQVRLKGIRVPVGANAIWDVKVKANNEFQLLGYAPPADVLIQAFFKGAKVREQQRTYIKIAKTVVGDVTSHYTGRPQDQLGGRRRRRRRSLAGLAVEV